MKFKPAYLMLALAIAGCRNSEEAQLPVVQTETVVDYNAVPSVVYPAKTYADISSNVSFRVSGNIRKVTVKPGDRVSKGDLVAVLDDRDYEMQFKATTAEYRRVKAEVERVKALYKENAVSENDYDKARYGMEQMKQKYAHHRAQYEDCALRSPINGYVKDVFLSKGETVAAGIPVLSIFDGRSISLHVNLSAEDYLRSSMFGDISAEFSALPGQVFTLRKESLSRVANSNQLYQMRLALIDAPDVITPGMTAQVTISFGNVKSDKVLIPSTALFNEGDGSRVYVYDEDSRKVSACPVEVLEIIKEGKAVVLGVSPGVDIVSAGVAKLTDGQKVRKARKPGNNNPGGLL